MNDMNLALYNISNISKFYACMYLLLIFKHISIYLTCNTLKICSPLCIYCVVFNVGWLARQLNMPDDVCDIANRWLIITFSLCTKSNLFTYICVWRIVVQHLKYINQNERTNLKYEIASNLVSAVLNESARGD